MSENFEFTIRHFEKEETQNFLRGILRKNQSIPFLGTGFTAGEKSRSGIVPFGSEWMQIMRDQIKGSSVHEKPTDTEVERYSFQELSDVYFREEVVALEKIKETINSLFTKVEISSEAKKEFLNIDWPYIYTLNIDDAIENCIDAVKVLPYKSFATYKDRRYVYKLHGDAEDVLIAPDRKGLNVVFGKGDYIRSLKKNEPLLADMANDFAEKHIMFIGCSLTDEIDISFALASSDNLIAASKNARLYVTSTSPEDYTTKKKLKSYGITDVIVVNDYTMFYSFAAAVAKAEDNTPNLLSVFEFTGATIKHSKKHQLEYLVQNGWKSVDDPYFLSIPRTCEKNIKEKLKHPIVVVWGRRFSGKTTLLYRILNEVKTRKSFFISSAESLSDKLFNQLFQAKNSLIVIDTHVLHTAQLNFLASKSDTFQENNTTLLLAIGKSELNAFGYNYTQEAIELSSRFDSGEAKQITAILDTFGFQKWNVRDNILDNVFSLSRSPVLIKELNGKTRLDERVKSICDLRNDGNASKLEFECLYYMAVRQRMFSKIHRALSTANNIGYMSDAHMKDFPKKWSPFVEWDVTDAVTRSAENSGSLLICNSYAWVQFALRITSERLGIESSAERIVELFSHLKKIETDAFELVLFDSLNAVYETQFVGTHDWRAGIIRLVYEKLSSVMSQDPDYWLQRAKSIYYMSSNEDELRAAVAYCEKGIIEKKRKTWTNAKLTKANLLGKLCAITNYRHDEDLIRAVGAYAEAIQDRDSNPTYIDSLLKKSRDGLSNMNNVCREASTRPSMLPHKGNIQFITAYLTDSR